MQISDKLGQYNRNVTNGSEELRGAQSMQKLVSSVGDLSTGSVFEGTVNHVRGSKVILALGNGQVISARIEGKVDMKPGTAMFFQVKSNDGLTVSIRPYSGVGNAGNPILLNALTAAQIPVTDRTLTMVDAMMQEHMSVDKKSILDMVKILNANPGANVQTIVQMTKIGMPVTEEMAAQFENYLSNRHELLNEMELAAGQIAEAFADETIEPDSSVALFCKVMDVFAANQEGVLTDTINQNNERPWSAETMIVDTEAAVKANKTDTAAIAQNFSGEVMAHGENTQMPLGVLLSEEQITNLTETLRSIPTLAYNTELFVGQTEEEVFVDTMQSEPIPETSTEIEAESLQEAEIGLSGEKAADKTVLNRDMTAGEFLRTVQRSLLQYGQDGYSGVQKLFASREFQVLFRDMIEQQWLLSPQDVKESSKIHTLYEKMERQVQQMQSAMQAVGITDSSFYQTAADIRGNIEFMNQMNQIYNYVQLPLKMMGQHANGELYVYTNKKQMHDPDAELSAFLHLDMEHLGSTDVSVRMIRKQVKTNFYFEDDASYDIVEKHLPILEKRLKNKGYNCVISITNEKKDINFKESFVKKGSGISGGSVHRYSFDVRA